jgi:hypothetical protein
MRRRLAGERSPALGQALWTAQRAGYGSVVVDGTLIPIDWWPPTGPMEGQAGLAQCGQLRSRLSVDLENARLKTWKISRKLRCRPVRAGQLVKAIFIL